MFYGVEFHPILRRGRKEKPEKLMFCLGRSPTSLPSAGRSNQFHPTLQCHCYQLHLVGFLHSEVTVKPTRVV